MIVYALNCVVDCYLLLQQAWIFIKPPGKINFKKQSILQVFGPKNKTLQINFIKGISYNKDIDFVVMSISKYSTPPCLEVAGFSYEFHKLGTFHIAFFSVSLVSRIEDTHTVITFSKKRMITLLSQRSHSSPFENET